MQTKILDTEIDESTIRELIFNAFGVFAQVQIAEGKIAVRFPLTKGALLSRFLEVMGVEDSHIIATGDSVHDVSLMRSIESCPQLPA